jgi:anthranilate phosphoribosyltransferase
VAHRSDHASNASVLLRCLQSGPVDPARDLVERNAALILDAARGFTLSQSEALATARQARQEGRAAGLLRDMMRDLEAA